MLNPRRNLLLGAVWTVGQRMSIKGLGFLNTMIMARLLVPADYGVVAMAMLVVGLIQSLIDFGSSTAILRKETISKDEIDSAWTMTVIQHIVVACLLVALAPFAVRYFSEPRVQGVLWVLSICICAAGFGNIGLTLARKQFSFAIDYKANVYGKLIGVLATIVAGFYFRDYRGLVAGIASGYLAGLILSYALHPYRPAWNVSKIAEIWQITKWLMMAGISGFILRKGDELIAGRIGGSGEFGRYNVGADLGQTPVGEVGPAMLRAFLPVLASINGTTSEVNYAVLKTIAVVNSIVIPLGLGFSALALPVTGLFLGPHWSGAAKYAAAFGVISVLQVILSPCNTLLVYCGATKVQNSVVWLEFFAFVVAAFLLVGQWGLLGLAFARIVSSLVNCIATVFVVRRYCQFDTYHLINAVGRPLLGAVLMYALITQIIVPQVEGMLLTVALSVMAGSVFYMIWSALSWWFTGKQPGLESTIYGYFQSRRS